MPPEQQTPLSNQSPEPSSPESVSSTQPSPVQAAPGNYGQIAPASSTPQDPADSSTVGTTSNAPFSLPARGSSPAPQTPDSQFGAPAPASFAAQAQNPASGQQIAQPYVQPKKTGGRLVLILAVLAGAILLIAIAALVYVHTRPTPDGVFKSAVENALSTKQVKQITTASVGSQELIFDTSAATDPRVYSHITMSASGVKVDEEQYATLKKSYVKYNDYSGMFKPGTAEASFKNKWMLERQNGKLTSSAGIADPLFPTDPYLYMFGDWLFANLSAKDRAELENYIIGQKVYSYDTSKVTKTKLNGSDVYVYHTTSDLKKKIEMNKKLATMWGADPATIEKGLTDMPLADHAVLYVDIKTKELVKVDADSGGETIPTSYSSFNSATAPNEPASQASYADFLRSMTMTM